MVRVKKLSVGDPCRRPKPLANQILEERLAVPRKRKSSQAKADDDNDAKSCDERLSRKIFKIAKEQRDTQNELHGEEQGALDHSDEEGNSKVAKNYLTEAAEQSDGAEEFTASNEYEEYEVDEDDLAAFDSLFPNSRNEREALSSMMWHTSKEKLQDMKTRLAASSDAVVRDLDPEVLEMYRNVGKALSAYTVGKVPKAFKIIPQLVNWEQILYITEPEKWSNAAVFQATRIFASNMNSRMCEKFYNIVLLPRIQDDLVDNKKLNRLLYQALFKSLYKPAAFFKGILLPLCQGGSCTLREAVVLGSVLKKGSIPALHAAAAMVLISQTDFSSAGCLFLRILVEKGYTLPFMAIDSIVNYFVGFIGDRRELPVIWHQALLALVKQYKSDLSSEQKDALLDLVREKSHYLITPEIRREIVTAVPRDVEDGIPMPMEE
ncbi:bystin [Trichuris trichiura]|uniref:Bystin n=1 Tax=Trichuris trichiura TaxID=36087 RepID=A0A077ZAL7_TRITR|nr:bystin [Trichuris trichiura]